MENKRPQATEKVIVERSEFIARRIEVHTIYPELLGFIHHLPYWTVCCNFNATQLDGSISPLYDFDEVCEFIGSLTPADIEHPEDIELFTEDGLTDEFFNGDIPDTILVQLAPVDDESDGE